MNGINKEVTIPDAMAGQRVDVACAMLFPDYSRGTLARWIIDGSLIVDGKAVKPKTKVLGGEKLTLNAILEPREKWHVAQNVSFEIVHQDNDIIVVNKPCGLVVHPGAGNPDKTLVNGLLARHADLAFLPRGGIVHRLDKDTTGLLLVATNLGSYKKLVAAIQKRDVGRYYEAIVEGRMISGLEIDEPIGRNPHNRILKAIRSDGRPAQTSVSILERFQDHTYVRVKLQTGRTHQIRVHLSGKGFPLLGDKAYGYRGRLPININETLSEALAEFDSQALHAARLTFTHPTSNEHMDISVDAPSNFQNLVALLRQHSLSQHSIDD